MTGIFGILDMGKQALLTQQKAIDVTSHNIANVNTPGYSRQRLHMETSEPFSDSPGQIGTGVRAAEIQSVYDRFLSVQINSENESLGEWEAKKEALEKVEMVLDESSGHGLSQAMSDFWNAWQDLANSPSGQTERVSLVDKSQILASTFNNMAANMEQIREGIDTSLVGAVEEINGIAEQISGLNQRIQMAEGDDQNPNDLRDKRDVLLSELSSIIDITSFEGNDGKVTVLVGGGMPLVEGITFRELSTETNAEGLQDILWMDSKGNPENITAMISGGKLGGWLDARDASIPEYLNGLDAMAAGIVQEVNNLHTSGFGLDGSTGNTFFDGSSASDIAVNSDVCDDVNMVAAAGAASGVPGDNSKAIAIANLQHELMMNGNTATFDDYYNSVVADVGFAVQEANMNYDNQSAILDQLNSYRESVSGVSLDEEMVNLIKFQHAYEAAAKLISTVDELLTNLLDMR
jgi:flagellar hook-associated protein 1 FlgK